MHEVGHLADVRTRRAGRRRRLRLYPAAMTEMRSVGTLGDLLASRRQRRFVGRASEVELFRIALESPEPPFVLLHLHGPPGIGKTSLLGRLRGACGRRRRDRGSSGRARASSRRRRRCCRPSGRCSRCPTARVPSPGRPAAVGWWSCATPMSGWRRWMTGSALGCCRACRPPPSRSSPDGSHRVRPGAPTRPGGSCCGWCRCAT